MINWRVKFRLFQALTYGIVFLAIAFFATVTGKYIETIAMFVSFVYLRNSFGKTWHSKSFWVCIFASCAIFAVSIVFVPNRGVSVFACVVFAFVIDYVAYKYRDYCDVLVELNKPFDVETCTTEELLTRCREIGLSEENTKLAVEFFIKKTKQSVIADDLCINEKSVQIRKKRLKEKLNKK